MAMPTLPNSNSNSGGPASEDVQAIREVFDQFNLLNIENATRQLNLDTGVNGEMIADTVILMTATAKESFEAYEQAFLDQIEADELPRVFVQAMVEMADKINQNYIGLSHTHRFPLNGEEIVAWKNGGGPQVTEEHVTGLIAYVAAMQQAMGSLREVMTNYVRKGDGYSGEIFSFAALIHYMQDLLQTCDCKYMDMGFDEGVILDGIPGRAEEILSRLEEDSSHLKRVTGNQMSNAMDGDAEMSSDLRSMMEKSGTMMN